MSPDDGASDAPPRPWARRIARVAPPAVLLAAALAAYWSGLPQALSPSAIGREAAMLRAMVAAHPAAALSAFVLIYAALTGACVPATALSLLGGLVFGAWLGAGAAIAGATGGALLTYGAVRSAFAPLLFSRAQRDPRLQKIIQGFGRSAFSYVLTLRLLPVVPFAAVNIASGLAAVPLRAFVLATVVGGAPAALIYSGLGAGLGGALATEQSLQSALRSPWTWAPLVGLALLSAAPSVVGHVRRRSRAAD